MNDFTRRCLRAFGYGIALCSGLAMTVLLAQTATAWTGGETLTSTKLNAVVADLNTLFTTDARWTKNGAAANYTAGNVGVGTATPGTTLHVVGTSRVDGMALVFGSTEQLSIVASAGSTIFNSNYTGGGGPQGQYIFQTRDGLSTLERMRIAASGNVGVGTAAPADKFSVGNKVLISDSNSPSNPPAGGAVLFMNAGNDLLAKDSAGENLNIGNFTASDSRLKKDITRLDNQTLTRVMSLSPVYFNWDRSVPRVSDYTSKRQIGLIAQEVERLYPEMVSTDSAGYKRIDYSRMIPVLLAAIQGQQTEIVAARQDNAALRRELAEIRTALAERGMLPASTKKVASANSDSRELPPHDAVEPGILRRAIRWLW